MTQNETTNPRFTRKQLIAIEALATRSAEETMEEVAQRAGMSRSTLYRLLKDDSFYIALQLRVRDMSRSYMGAVMRGLAQTAAKGDAGCQRIYWQLAGKLQESIEVTSQRRGIDPVTIDPGHFSPEFREELLLQIRQIKGEGNRERNQLTEGTGGNGAERNLDLFVEAVELPADMPDETDETNETQIPDETDETPTVAFERFSPEWRQELLRQIKG